MMKILPVQEGLLTASVHVYVETNSGHTTYLLTGVVPVELGTNMRDSLF